MSWGVYKESSDVCQRGCPQSSRSKFLSVCVNPLKAELNPICHLLALLEANHIFHISGVRVNNWN